MLRVFNRRQKDLPTPYFSNNIGLRAPSNNFDYEFLITGKNEDEAQSRVITTFLSHNIKLISFNSNLNPSRKRFISTIVCNLEDSNFSPKDIVSYLRDMKFVIDVEYKEMLGRMFTSQFPLTFYDIERAVAVRSDTLLKLGKSLAKWSGSAGTAVLYQGGREYILAVIEDLREILKQLKLPFESYSLGVFERTAEAYCVKCKQIRLIGNPTEITMKNNKRAIQGVCPVCSTKVFKIGSKTFGKIVSSILFENVQGFLAAAGWGTFELRGEIEGKVGNVTILDPPTIDGDLSYGNQFLEGIAAALLESIVQTSNRLNLVGQSYNPAKRILNLSFAEHVDPRQPVSKPPVVKQDMRESRMESYHENKAKQTEPTSYAEEKVKEIVQSLKEDETHKKVASSADTQEGPGEIFAE